MFQIHKFKKLAHTNKLCIYKLYTYGIDVKIIFRISSFYRNNNKYKTNIIIRSEERR